MASIHMIILVSIYFVMCAIASEEFLDFVTVYHINENKSSVFAIKEYHRLTNSRGMLLRTKDFNYIDSVKGMNSLMFSPLDSTCKINLSAEWKFEKQDISESEHFSIAIDELADFSDPNCTIDNGGCQVFCYTSNAKSYCSCPNGFAVDPIRKTCWGNDPRYFVHENLSGVISGWQSQHLIIAPANCTIKLDFDITSNPCQNCYLKVYEYDKSGRETLLANMKQNEGPVFSTTNIIHIILPNERHFAVKYIVLQSLPTLTSASGQLDFNMSPISRIVCLSVIYKCGSTAAPLQILAMQNNDIYNASKTYHRQVLTWNIDQFKVTLKNKDPVSFSLSAHGAGTVIHSISGCSPYGSPDVTFVSVIPSSFLPVLRSYTVSQEKESISNCFNGGVYDISSKNCNCLPGYTGHKCEQGCGPNRYGNDCGTRCSNFEQRCSGIIFCKKDLPCLCAPGFSGKYCKSSCIPGFYGASCRILCGNCKEGQCNIYTGVCDGGCLPGYYPPLCKDTYAYLEYSPNITYSDFNMVTLTANTSHRKGRGYIKFYQVQCKEVSAGQWLEYPHYRYSLEQTIVTNVTGLKPGGKYEARIVFFDKDGNSYQGDLVPRVQFASLCRVPESRKYSLQIWEVTSSSFEVAWKFIPNKTDCPVIGYEVVLRKNWEESHQNVSSDQNKVKFEKLLSGETYSVEIQALTDFGRAPLSEELLVKTEGNIPEEVVDLKVIPINSVKLQISWREPRYTGGEIEDYLVTYKCVKFLACSQSCEGSEGEVITHDTSVVLEGLLPHAQYFVTVAGKVRERGPISYAYGATDDTVPYIAPSSRESPVLSSSNSSLTIGWLTPTNCSQLNGYMLGYRFELLSPDNKTLLIGNTTDTNATFSNLSPQTNYVAKVYVVTSAGWSANHKLDIHAQTAATVPEPVRNLTVYKQARRMLGIRWALPEETYGEIKLFSVSYHHGKSKEVIDYVYPTKCIPWPDLFCHVIGNLTPNKKYTVTVRARNVLVEADGRPALTTSFTSEGAPGSPVSLTVVKRTSTTMSLQWSPPFIFNGILRSFVINVEQVDAANSSECCDYYPVQEMPVKEEQQFYHFQASNLKPASKYIIGVSSKTLTIGATSNVTVNTPPEEPELEPPILLDDGIVKFPPPLVYPGVEITYLLLVILKSENSPEIWDAEVKALLQEAVNASFYIVKELKNEDMLQEPEVELGIDATEREGLFGKVKNPPLLPGMYRLGLAAVLDYGGAKAVGFAATDYFDVER